jgi:nucleotide-binding universal stress UspA family protein
MKTILVPLGGQAGDAAGLETAYRAAQLFESHLTCLHVRRNSNDILARTTSLGMGMPVITPELWTALEEEDKAMNANARRAFDDFCVRKGMEQSEDPAQAMTVAWHEVSGDPVHQVIRYGRTSDLIVVGRGPEPAGSPGPIGDVLVQCGRPLILAPQTIPATLGTTIAIAWKPTAEAARALTASMPFLKQAKKVLIVAAEEGGNGNADADSGARLARSLEWNGIHAVLHTFKAPDAPPHILDVVMKSGADLMVMGAYSHSRTSEFIFGGLTRRVLVDAGIPVLLCH